MLVAVLQVASAFWCPVWRLDGGGYTRRQAGVAAQVHRTWCCDPSGGGAQLHWKRRLVLRTAGCAAGGLFLPAPASSAVSDRSSTSAIRSVSVVAEDEETKRANLDMLDFFSSQEMPFALNELDSATVEALSREEEFLRAEEKLASDAIFTFRGEQLLKTNPEGAVRYMSRRNAVFFGETHDSSRDKRLATRILRQLKMKRGSVALGLEMVQQPFQPVLDWYVYRAPPSKAADRTLFRETEWESRWGWDFEGYLPILRYAQLHKVPMIALNVEAELTARVRKQVRTFLHGDVWSCNDGIHSPGVRPLISVASPRGDATDIMGIRGSRISPAPRPISTSWVCWKRFHALRRRQVVGT